MQENQDVYFSQGLKEEQKKKWRCKECHFDNYHLLTSCEICQAVRPGLDASKQKKLKEAVISCTNKECNAENPLQVEYCIKCGHPLFEEKPLFSRSEKTRINKDLIKCPKCSFQNHNSNKKCLNCSTFLNFKPKPFHSIFGGIPTCDKCGSYLTPISSMFASEVKYDVCDCQLQDVVSSGICSFCDTKISSADWKAHQDKCEKKKWFLNKQNPTFDRCSDLQIRTIIHMQTKSQKRHNASKQRLLARVRKIGYTEEDLENLHHYITHYAPIIVHMRASNFTYYAKDTHYRNAFEIHPGMGGGGGRVEWEDRMFDRMHHDATPFERVKYGTMNFTNDPNGVAVCSGYGSSYFLLKPHLRDRCTITDMDSASPMASIGTFRFMNHILAKLQDNELISAFEGSKGKEMLSGVIKTYKEIQIHGPLQFSKDISRVYICKLEISRDQSTKKLIEEFCAKNKLEWEQFQPRKLVGMIGGGSSRSFAAPTRFIAESKIEKQEKEKEEESLAYSKKSSSKKRYRR